VPSRFKRSLPHNAADTAGGSTQYGGANSCIRNMSSSTLSFAPFSPTTAFQEM
jgi:hypothetical protein